MDALEAANALAEAMLGSAEYREYIKARDLLRTDSRLNLKTEEYKTANMECRLDASESNYDSDAETMLSATYSDLMLNELSRNYLLAEERLYGLINRVHGILGEAYGEI